MRHFFLAICLLMLTTFAHAEIHFPAPQGYVNDYAKMLPIDQVARLNNALSAFERQTSNQVVVATFDSLGGQSIENSSLQLARQWRIGSSKHDNGVLLLILKNDRKIRIEVGYGLEGTLTDALSSSIIRNQIAPAFKRNDYASGITNGVTAILQATLGEYKPENITETDFYNTTWFWSLIIFLLLFNSYSYGRQRGIKIPIIDPLFVILTMLLSPLNRNNYSSRYTDAGGSRNDSNGNRSSGGFSGGGGKFGGGGASGGW